MKYLPLTQHLKCYPEMAKNEIPPLGRRTDFHSTMLEYGPCSLQNQSKMVEASSLRLMRARYFGELHCVPERLVLNLGSKSQKNASKVTWEIGNFFFDENANLDAKRIKVIMQTGEDLEWGQDIISLTAGSGLKPKEVSFQISPFCIKAKANVKGGNGHVELFIVLF